MVKLLLAELIVMAAFISAQAPNAESIAGTWVIDVRSHRVGLGLEQDGTKLTGTLVIMGRNVPVDGQFVDRALKLASLPDETSPISLSGTLKDDGTLEGLITTPHGTMTWTAERLKPPK